MPKNSRDSSSEIVIVDYGIGNVSSVSNMLHHLGIPAKLSCDPSDIEAACKIILPGNGSFNACMSNLRANGLIPILEHQVLHNRIPILGICVGAQVFGHCSAEGSESGLGWVDMHVDALPYQYNLRVPHMGWNTTISANKYHFMNCSLESNPRFYFVHSYYMKPARTSDVLMYCHYGFNFAAAIANNNIIGVQFHPEKSHRYGKQFIQAFADWRP